MAVRGHWLGGIVTIMVFYLSGFADSRIASDSLGIPGSPPDVPPHKKIEESSEVLEVQKGQTLEVNCSVVGNPSPQVSWSFGPNGERIPLSIYSRDGLLIFNNTHSDASDEYFCTATNNQGTYYERIIFNIEDRVSSPSPTRPDALVITVQVSKQSIEASSGETVRVTCTADRPGITTISWSRRTGALPSQAVVARGELQIVNALPADSGIYVCRITDERTGHYEEASSNITITENVIIPAVSIQPDRQTIYQGTDAELRCLVTGDPPPVVTWLKANDKFGEGVVVDGSVLRIVNAVISDRGMYICSAKDIGGTALAAATVEVERPRPGPDQFATIVVTIPEPSVVITGVGSTQQFQCSAVNINDQRQVPVTWSKLDGALPFGRAVDNRQGLLEIRQIQVSDSGVYICTASDGYTVYTGNATLRVQAPPPSHCSDADFECQNGDCVQQEYTCDGRRDCTDGSDEINCSTHEPECTSNQFLCSSGECVRFDKRCNEYIDCLDGSDELGCPAMRLCMENEFRCKDGVCISKDWICDKVPDCSDASDEMNCTHEPECTSNQFLCSSGECVRHDERCNEIIDCLDGSDELECPAMRLCMGNEFRCKDGVCISKEWICDKVPDCSDASDEMNCF